VQVKVCAGYTWGRQPRKCSLASKRVGLQKARKESYASSQPAHLRSYTNIHRYTCDIKMQQIISVPAASTRTLQNTSTEHSRTLQKSSEHFKTIHQSTSEHLTRIHQKTPEHTRTLQNTSVCRQHERCPTLGFKQQSLTYTRALASGGHGLSLREVDFEYHKKTPKVRNEANSLVRFNKIWIK